MGYKVIGFESPEEIDHSTNPIVVGGINTIRRVFDMMNLPQPNLDNPHELLPGYLGRNVFEASFEEVEQYDQFPFFIKPLRDHKLFTGYVVKSKHDLLQAKLRCRPESRLIVSEVVDFVSEYRCFVLNGRLIGSKNYTGDFTVSPDYSFIESAIRDYNNQPAAYSIDFGVTQDGRTLLIEMNDAFGLSAYGLNKIAYCKMLEARWDEISKRILT
jgi:D-alanine-D-alanine ligase-like ATP-grasp enzyme